MNDQQKDKLERAKLIRETTGARLVDVLHLMTVFETDDLKALVSKCEKAFRNTV